MLNRFSGTGLLSLAVALSLSAPSMAQESVDEGAAPDGQVEADAGEESTSALSLGTVTVTARKTEENLQDTPIAISAFTSEDLELRGTTDLTDLSGVAPNLSFETCLLYTSPSPRDA